MINILLADDDVKEIIIKKNNIQSDISDGAVRNVDVNLSIQIVYNNQQNHTKSITLSEYMDYWLYEVKKRKLKPTSFDRLENMVKYQVIAELGNKIINDVTTEDVQYLIDVLKEKKYSYSTIKKSYEALRACLNYAVSKQVISRNPAEYIEFLKKEIEDGLSDDVRFFSDNEIMMLKNEALSVNNKGEYIYRLGNVFVLLLTTGIRVGETLALRWSDVNLENKIMRVNKRLSIVKNRDNGVSENSKKYTLIEQNPKTKNSDRVVPLSDAAITALKELYKITGHYELVVANKKGGYVLHKNLDRTFKSILEHTGIRKTGIHTLRHTFASKLFRNGVYPINNPPTFQKFKKLI